MTELFFDVALLRTNGVAGPDGAFRTFADLGLADGERLQLHARELTIESAPFGRDLLLVADTLTAKVPLHYTDTGFLPKVEVWAQQVSGALSISAKGRTGPQGPQGPRGPAAEWHWEVIRGGPDDDGPVVKPVREKVLDKPAGRGGPGGPGGRGGPGGTVRISFGSASSPPQAAAPGGAGGPGGPGGPGGSGNGFGNGPVGPAGPAGPVGPPGTATVTPLPGAEIWKRYAAQAAGSAARWAAYRVKVAEYHYRRGGVTDLQTAKAHLKLLVDRPGTGAAQARARKLTQQLYEGTTYLGQPRDVDVTPDVVFAAETNQPLHQTALALLGNAQSVAGTSTLHHTFAQFVRIGAAQGQNSLTAAGKRVEESAEHLKTAKSSTDIAQGRVAALDARLQEIQKEISSAPDPDTSFFGIMSKVLAVGVAVAGVASGVGAGVGAAVAIGQGFAELSKTAADAKTLVDLVHDVKEKLKDPEGKAFVKGFDDIGKAGKSIFHLGKMVDELSAIGTSAPHPLLREMATVQRERVLLLKEVTLHRQMEKEAQLGADASKAEQDAISANIVLANGFARQLDNREKVETDPVLQTLITSVRQLLDLLSVAMFRTLRAKEIYLGKDLTEIVRHDLGYLHPDRDQLLPLTQQVSEITTQVAQRGVQIITWSSLVDSMDDIGELSQTPMTFWFSTEDVAHLDAFRSTGRFGFAIPVADLREEDGSQIYEAKFDGATVVLHGARIRSGSGQSVRLKQLGRWSFRRRPDPANPTGLIVDQAMPHREIHLNARQLEKSVEAAVVPPSNPRSQPPVALWGRGIAGDWELADAGDIDLSGLTRVEVGFATQALSGSGGRGTERDAPRLLRPLVGWPPKPVPARGPTPVPARGWSTYGYGGGVAAVGAGLI